MTYATLGTFTVLGLFLYSFFSAFYYTKKSGLEEDNVYEGAAVMAWVSTAVTGLITLIVFIIRSDQWIQLPF